MSFIRIILQRPFAVWFQNVKLFDYYEHLKLPTAYNDNAK